jgi:hypothetical protein
MSETREGSPISPENQEQGKRHKLIWGELATAFGGHSQVPLETLGQAIAGQVNNNNLEFGPAELDEIVDQVVERADDFQNEIDPNGVREDIIRGMKKSAEGWKDDKSNRIWPVLEAIEK